MVLTVVTAEFNIVEPDMGDIELIEACFEVQLNRTLNRDAIFELVESNLTTAELMTDYYINVSSTLLTIPAGSRGYLRECFNFTILGDDTIEDDETIVYSIRPLSELDTVEFPQSSNSSLTVNIIDNDGKQAT